MAMGLDALESYLRSMLTEMANEEVGMLLGVSSEIDKMGSMLDTVKSLITDSDINNMTKVYRVWARQIKDVIYEATNILDLCQLKAMEHIDPSAQDVGCFNPLLCCLQNPIHAHDIGGRIKELNERLDDLCNRVARYDLFASKAYNDRNQIKRAGHRTVAFLEQSGIVGEKIKDDTRELVEKLVKDEGENNVGVMVFAIVGTAGIGKTTLALKIYKDVAVRQHFNIRIWLNVTQEPNLVELLKMAIFTVNADIGLAGANDITVLTQILADTIRDRRFLLVLDDMWSDGEWNSLLMHLFTRGAPGSRVLITTRNEGVARNMRAILPFHRVAKLGTEDAWSLLKKQVVLSEIGETEIDMLEDIGLRIVAKCDGLPLAVKVMGGLLSQEEITRYYWEVVLKAAATWSASEMFAELNLAAHEMFAELHRVIYLSYKDLPSCLKQCFLHYSLLPKKTVFYENDIVGMWISEGFVHGNSHELEELGRTYYSELILRNLIDTDARYTSQRVCIMNDVVRSFAQSMCEDEAFIAHSGEPSMMRKLSSKMFFRLSLGEGLQSDMLDWRSLQEQKSLRTLISIGHINLKHGDSLLAFSTLRTLHIESANATGLVESLCQLKHLRYLSFAHCHVSRLPENINKMKLLQHINLDGCESLKRLPDSIIKLGQLRYLNLNGTSIISIPRGFSDLKNLRKLYGFPVHMDRGWCSLDELEHLFLLQDIGLKGLENIPASSFAAKVRLGEKEYLTYLKLGCTTRSGGDDQLVKEGENVFQYEENQGIEAVFDELCSKLCHTIDIQGYFGRRLPVWMTAMQWSLTSLVVLTMEDLACCIQLPDGLCQLPRLKILKIRRAPAIKYVGPEFLGIDHYSTHTEALFRRLRELVLFGMVEWEEWKWEVNNNVQAMPVLEELLLSSCKLSHVPPGLAFHARALKRLVITAATNLNSLENFTSVVELDVRFSPKLTRIANLPELRKLTIVICPKLNTLVGVRTIRRLVLEDYDMKTLPGYLQHVPISHLQLDGTLELLTSTAVGISGPERYKFRHIEHIEAYARDGNNPKAWSVVYTTEPYCLKTNIMLPDELNAKDNDSDKLVRTDNSSGSAVVLRNDDDDKLVGIDNSSGSAVVPRNDNDDKLVDTYNSIVPRNDDDDKLVDTYNSSGSAVVPRNDDDDELVDTYNSSGSAVVLPNDDDEGKLIGTSNSSGSAVVLPNDDPTKLVGTENGTENPSWSAFWKEDHELVGIHTAIEDLIKVLMHGDTQLKVFSICGIGGLGKTALAKAIGKETVKKFECRAFVSVESRNPDENKIIRGLFCQLVHPCPDIKEWGVEKIKEEVTKRLQGKRSLIVVDDIWDISVLDLIRPLIDRNNGSRIITTTRIVAVAEKVGGVYYLPLLSDNDSKSLFYSRTLFGSEDHCPLEFRESSDRMLSKCGQLPLAIIAITSLLPGQLMDLEKWKEVCSSIVSGLKIGESVKDMRKILQRSYDDLSPELKACVLYLSIFPEGHKVIRDHLVQRWIAEDLISVGHGQNLHELGENYFDELVNRNWIQPIEFDSFGKALVCRVPVPILDLIVYLSTEDKYVTILPASQQQTDPAHKVKRLSLQGRHEKHDVPRTTKTFRQVTSLSIFCGTDLMPSLSRFQGLHVLDLVKCESLENHHLNGIGNLARLRYLILGGSHITVIPKKIGNLQLLQTLDLTATGVKELPSSIVNLTQLRYLLINRSTKVPAGIGRLQALEELVHIDISKSPSILERVISLPELRVLSIALWSWDDHHSSLLPGALSRLSTQKLKHLSVFTCCSLDFKADSVPVFQHLEKLEIQGSTFNKLPVWISNLSNLRSLCIEVFSLDAESLQTLGTSLTELLFLSLTAKKVTGEKLVLQGDVFRSLKYFLLFNRAVSITFTKGAMKNLQRLELTLQASLAEEYSCTGLDNLSSLRHVKVEIICSGATDELVKKAEAAIKGMIDKNPNYPKSDIKRTMKQYMVQDKKKEADCEIEEEGEKEADREVEVGEQSVTARKKSRRAQRRNKRRH